MFSSRYTWLRVGAVLAAVVLSACGGGGDEPAVPRVTLSASSQSIEGGAFVALTTTATDAAGATLTPSLSCTQGTLQGTMLLTPTVTEDTPVTCTATATDGNGRVGTAQVTITVTATVASLELGEDQSVLAPGQLGVLFADDIALTADSYEAMLGGTPVTLHHAGDGLLYFEVPVDAAAGSTLLQTTINGRPWEFDVELGAAASVADPRAVVRSALEAADAELAQIEADAGSAMTAAELDELHARREALASALDSLEDVSDDVLGAAAQQLIAMGYAQADAAAPTFAAITSKAFTVSGCAGAIGDASGVLTKLAVAIVAAGLGAEAVVVGPDPVSRIVGAALAGAGFVFVWKQADADSRLQTGLSNIRSNCFEEVSFLLKEVLATADASPTGQKNAMQVRALTAKAAQHLAFENAEPRYFRPESLVRVQQDFLSRVANLFARINATISKLPVIPESVSAILEGLATEETKDVAAGSVGLGPISSGNVPIGGSAAAVDGLLQLEFSATDPENLTDEEVDFSFTLTRPGVAATPVNGTLSIDLPEAEDAATEVIQGVAASSTVTTVGADTLEIVTSPTHGSVVLQNDGSFVFTPAGQYFGPDQFTYRARNENGHSRAATVAVNIKRKFDGAWTLEINRTLTSSNPDGLCEEEPDTTEVVGVSKITETLYQASYAGQTIDLTMSSANDASGLSGSLSVSYPDGPDDEGETTESLSVRIPDSTHLSGTLTWSYGGPNGTCTGNSVITGTRAPGPF